MLIDTKLAEQLYRRARAERWRVPAARFAEALSASTERAAGVANSDARTIARYLEGLHLEDLALACACADGDERAWEHFVTEYRPLLYRAADALDPGGGARELADSLYADLFGLDQKGSSRRSLFRYFHGRSSLITWLRAVLAQRHVDRFRAHRRFEALPDDASLKAVPDPGAATEADRPLYLDLIRRALSGAVSRLTSRDRLRLACYYAQELTLAQIGRLLGEHEATSSRHLARTRSSLRQDVEHQLRHEYGLSDEDVRRCFASVTEDAGPIDLQQLLDTGPGRKKSTLDRSS